jgi:CspA family cold shock protein
MNIILKIAKWLNIRLTGRVDWFNRRKGFGFIQLSNNRQLFVHSSQITGSKQPYLKPNQTVKFKIGENKQGFQAEDVQIDTRQSN